VDIEEEDTLKMVEELVGLGYETGEFMRYFIHTHPGQSPQPSTTDEKTYREIFGKMDWSSMIIFAKEGATFCRTQFQAGPGAVIEGDLRVHFSGYFPGVDEEVIGSWAATHKDRVTERTYVHTVGNGNHTGSQGGRGYSNEYGQWIDGHWVLHKDKGRSLFYDTLPDDFDWRNDDEFWETYMQWLAKDQEEKIKRRSGSNGKKSEYHFGKGDFTAKERIKIDKTIEELKEVMDPEPILPKKEMILKYPNTDTRVTVHIEQDTAQAQYNAAAARLDIRYEEGVRGEFLRVVAEILKQRRAVAKERKKAADAASVETVEVPYPIAVD
jgi:hypothetical protein